MFVFDVLEHPASYLNGTITESITGTPLNNVSISIEGTDIEDFSNVPGYYATGIESEGIKMVDYFKVLYYPQSIPLNFVNGATRIQDVELEKIPEFSIDIKVLDSETLLPIEGVNVLFSHTYIDSEDEKKKLFNAIDNYPCVERKQRWAMKLMATPIYLCIIKIIIKYLLEFGAIRLFVWKILC